jgi:2-desacetyl-2-hydroxyethyl bacteriochlorophyllide A dehydrogenase
VERVEALICSEPGKLELVRLPSPPPRPGSALVRPRRVGVCGTDYHIFQGKHPFLNYPRVIGHELAVEVAEASLANFGVGEICVVNPYLSCGDCVACRAGKTNCCMKISVLGVHQDGGLVDLMSVPVGNLIHAEGLGVDACASVEFLAIGAHAVRRGAVSERDSVLVVGAGPIGLGVALFARLTGATVAVFDRDPERAAVAQAIAGATPIAAGDDLAAAIAAYTSGNGFDVVFDATGNRTAMETGFAFVSHGGRYVLVSVINDTITFMDPEFHRREMTLLGSRNATNDDFRRVIAAIHAGHIPIDRLITHRTSLAEAAHNIPIWATQKSGLIKALIEIGE